MIVCKSCEQIIGPTTFTSPHHRDISHLDQNGDGKLTADDALILNNRIGKLSAESQELLGYEREVLSRLTHA